jgi:hypothetical protein
MRLANSSSSKATRLKPASLGVPPETELAGVEEPAGELDEGVTLAQTGLP